MSYNFSITGGAATDEEEWQVMQALAKVVQDYNMSTAYGSTQFHGQVNLTNVQVFIPNLQEPKEEHPVADVNETTYDTSEKPDGTVELTPETVSPAVTEHTESGEGEVKTVKDADGNEQTVQTNAAGEVVGFA